MKCERFSAWLENRDTYDVSEADKAYRHAAECKGCGRMLKQDEILDRFIARSLAPESMPEGLRNRIDLSLQRSVPHRSRRNVLAALFAVCLVVVAVFAFNMGQQQFGSMDELATFALADHRDHGQRVAIFEPVVDAGVWLAANMESDISPPPQLVKGYTVKAARFCRLGHCRAVHMLYEQNGKLVSVFVVGAEEVGFHVEQGRIYLLTVEGHSVRLYKQKNEVYALVT